VLTGEMSLYRSAFVKRIFRENAKAIK